MAINLSPTQTAPITYLQFSEEELNPDLQAFHAKDSTMYRVAAIATVVAFSIIVGTAVIVTSIYFPLFLPLCLICSVPTLVVAKKVHAYFDHRSELASDRANQLAAIKRNFKEIEDFSPEQIQQLLQQRKINDIFRLRHNDPSLVNLKPLIARHIFWEDHVARLQAQQKDFSNRAAELESKDASGNRDKIVELRNTALEVEKDALESKVKNAFINAVIRRFAFAGTQGDLGTFSPLGGVERAALLQKNTPNANDLFTFKNGTSYTILYDEARNLDVYTLGTRIMTAMPA